MDSDFLTANAATFGGIPLVNVLQPVLLVLKKNKSSLNNVSAEIIPNILEELNKFDKVKEYSFGVITGYTAQCRELKRQLNKKIQKVGLKNIRSWNKQEEKLSVSVVDRFQG